MPLSADLNSVNSAGRGIFYLIFFEDFCRAESYMCSLKTLLSQKSSKSPKINEILHLKRFRRGIRAALIARAERFDCTKINGVHPATRPFNRGAQNNIFQINVIN
jgi:hypothetical protein